MIIPFGKLTKEQQQFANDYHYLVENFLKFRHLKHDEYYDVVVFGFLRAVHKYFTRSELKRYAFSTIAIYAMKSDLINHYRKLGRKKRRSDIVSLDSPEYYQEYGGNSLTMAETIAAPDTTGDTIEDYIGAEILWNNITSNLPAECVNVLRMKYEGYNDREIAKTQGITVKNINGIMEQIRDTVRSLRPV